MIVYKFGGASVNSADGVRNLVSIIHSAPTPLVAVVSAMGKTTNALEAVLEAMLAGDKNEALNHFTEVENFHNIIIENLMGAGARIPRVEELYEEVVGMIRAHENGDYDSCYDELVSYGELLSTTIISEYLSWAGIDNRWLDMRRCIITDARHRAAEVMMVETTEKLRQVVAPSPQAIFVAQGFIGGTAGGQTTTLGREGSDYTAAVVANALDAKQVVIWKDVPGILNADPRLFSDTVLIPELTYLDAVELAYSGAQVIHPKTIKPLQNKQIPLYVRPFADPLSPGSVIKGEMQGRVEVPVMILKKDQVLISIRPKDFSFVLQERLVDILSLLERNGLHPNLIQTSAVNLSFCVDAARTLNEVVAKLQQNFRVVYNDNLELLTIRGYTPEIYERYAEAEGVMLSQRTRRIVRIVRQKPVNGK